MRISSMEFIYKAMNALASHKHDPETEQCISDAIEQELLAINAQLVLGKKGMDLNLSTSVKEYPGCQR